MPISTNNFCLLSRKRFWWIGSNTSAQLGIFSVSGQSKRRLKTSVERSHLEIGYHYSLAETLTSNWESLQASILNEHRLSISRLLDTILTYSKRSLKIMVSHGRMSIIWTKRAVNEVGVEKHLQESILSRAHNGWSTRCRVLTLSWLPSLSVFQLMAQVSHRDLFSRARNSVWNGLRYRPTFGKCHNVSTYQGIYIHISYIHGTAVQYNLYTCLIFESESALSLWNEMVLRWRLKWHCDQVVTICYITT